MQLGEVSVIGALAVGGREPLVRISIVWAYRSLNGRHIRAWTGEAESIALTDPSFA